MEDDSGQTRGDTDEDMPQIRGLTVLAGSNQQAMVAEDNHGIMPGMLIGHMPWSMVGRLTVWLFSWLLTVAVVPWASLPIRFQRATRLISRG